MDGNKHNRMDPHLATAGHTETADKFADGFHRGREEGFRDGYRQASFDSRNRSSDDYVYGYMHAIATAAGIIVGAYLLRCWMP